MKQFLKETSGFALLSFSFGIFSIYCFIFLVDPDWLCPVTSLFAILFGIISLRNIKRKNYRGKSLAVLGIILGILELIIYTPLIISYYYTRFLFP